MIKWAVELSKFNMVFKTRTTVKGQALIDFVVVFVHIPEIEKEIEPIKPPTWNLFVDGSTGKRGSRAVVVLSDQKYVCLIVL